MTSLAAQKLGHPLAKSKWRLRLISLVFFALAWELFARRIDSLLMPSFTETLAALAQLLTAPTLWEALWVSNQAMVLGFAVGVTTGVPVGFLMGRLRAVERFLDPYLSILLATPMSALIPIIIMATGLGLLSRVLIIYTFSFVVIAVNTRAALRTVDSSWIEMAQAFGATERQLWIKILLRAALPTILTGLRLGLMRSVTGMVTVELLLIALGIGRLILDFQGGFESANLYATVFIVVVEATALAQLLKGLERRASPWLGHTVVE